MKTEWRNKRNSLKSDLRNNKMKSKKSEPILDLIVVRHEGYFHAPTLIISPQKKTQCLCWPRVYCFPLSRVCMLSKLHRSTLQGFDVMGVLREICDAIMRDHHSGQTECFYEKMIGQYLYERCIPFMTQVDCFIQQGCTQVLVGRIDMEIAHNTLIELKVGPRARQADIDQLMKYVRAKRACGMNLKNAAVVCFRTDGTVEIINYLVS